MRNVIYVVPAPGANSMRYVDALAGLEDIRLMMVCHRVPGGIPADVANRFHHIVQVDSAFDPGQVAHAVAGLAGLYGPIHRLTTAMEQLQGSIAEVRARLDIPGMKPDAIQRFFNKATMKDALRAAGLPCARHRVLECAAEGRDFVHEVGFPVILKPPVGAGCRSTYLVRNEQELHIAMGEIMPAPDRPVQAEEFIRGEEFSFETITVAGKVRMTSITCYMPDVLTVVRNPWIKYAILFPRELDAPHFAEIKKVGTKAVEALGMESGYTHMEWFRRADGSIVIGEVAARPPGVQIVPMMTLSYETSFYRVWARAVVDGAFDGPYERKWACGVAFLRGEGYGRVAGVEGVDEAERRYSPLMAEAVWPKPGTPKNEAYEGEGHVLLKGADTAAVKKALEFIVSTIRVHYTG